MVDDKVSDAGSGNINSLCFMLGYPDPGVERAPTPIVSRSCGTWKPQWGLRQLSKPIVRAVNSLVGKDTLRSESHQPKGKGNK